ncbi:hypothetical protein Hanom_Chr02g00165691 [Helianthus anomalus]
MVFLVTQIRLHSSHYFLWRPGGGRIRVAPVRLGWEARFTDYSTAVPSGGWRSGFRASGRAKGLAAVE